MAYMKYLILLCLIYIGCKSEHADGDISLAKGDQELIQYLFSDFHKSEPGASVLVIKEGKIIHQANFGLTSIESSQSNSSDANFRIASITKQFTAMAIMILEHQGKLSYKTMLTDIFPDFPDYGKDINIRHLLSNQSGIVDYYDFIDEEREEQYLDAEILDSLRTVDSTYFRPGSQYRYSNAGYAVLSQVVESVSGISFANFLEKEIFEKLGMKNTQVFELTKPIKKRVYGHSFEDGSFVLNDQSQTSTIQGDGGIYSSVMDYYKWDQALYTEKLIPSEKLNDAFSDWDNNQKTNTEGYGYGWYIDFSGDTKILNHSGGTAGFQHRVSRIPSMELTVVIFSNHDGYDRNLMHMTNALLSIYSNYKIPMPLEIIMKKEIDKKGISAGNEVYDRLKDDKRYERNKTTLSYLGFEYRRMQKHLESEGIFLKATKEQPNYFGGFYGLGHTYKENDIEKAIQNFKKVIELGTEDEVRVLERSKELVEELRNKLIKAESN